MFFIFLLFLLIFIGIPVGIIFLLTGAAHRKAAQICTSQTTGWVVEMQQRSSHDVWQSRPRVRITYTPVFTYVVSGNTFTQSADMGVSWQTLRPGDKVTILYNPEDPYEFYVPEYKPFRAFLIPVFVFIGILALLPVAAIVIYFVFTLLT